MCPFQNALAVCTLSGNKFRALLEHGVAGIYYEKRRLQFTGGAYPQFASYDEFSFVWNPHLAPGSRIVSTFPAIDDSAEYRIVTSAFVLGGGDGYQMFADDCKDIVNFGPTDADVVAAFMKDYSPLNPATDLGNVASS